MLFNMAMIYRSQGETEKAVELFTEIVTKYADAEQAEKARTQLAELVPQNQQAAVPGHSILDQGRGESQAAAEAGGESQSAESQAPVGEPVG